MEGVDEMSDPGEQGMRCPTCDQLALVARKAVAVAIRDSSGHFTDEHAALSVSEAMDAEGVLRGSVGRLAAGVVREKTARRGFTLIELLLVIVIILTISVVALPTVLPAISHRQVSEAARILQGALVGARDAAIHDNAPSGIRLLPDPTYNGVDPATGQLDPSRPLAYNRAIPISQPPEYTTGLVSVYPADAYPATVTGGLPALVLEQSVGQWVLPPSGRYVWVPNESTSWNGNARVGDKIQLNGAGIWYTVIGPMTVLPAQGNPEGFVNVPNPPDPNTVITRTIVSPDGQQVTVHPEWLLLVNGLDDNRNGWVDEGFDGADNNGNGIVDDAGLQSSNGVGEWEQENWPPSVASDGTVNTPYSIRRRPAAAPNAREIALPSSVVIDATTWGTTRERSRFPGVAFNAFSGEVDIVVNPDGSVVPTTIYSSPSSVGIDGAFYHFWLAERQDVLAPVGTNAPTLAVGVFAPPPVGEDPVPYSGPAIKGEYRLLTLFARSGQIASGESALFENPAQDATDKRPYNVNLPFTQAQQGVSSR